jgi:hypothetical protein
MRAMGGAAAAVRRLYPLESLRFSVGHDRLRGLLWAAAALCVLPLLPEAALRLETPGGALSPAGLTVQVAVAVRQALQGWVGPASLSVAVIVPAVYVAFSLWQEWAEGTAIWWLALPAHPAIRLAAKCARGLVLGWGLALGFGVTALVQRALHHLLDPAFPVFGAGLWHGAAQVLLVTAASVAVVAAAAEFALWALWLMQRPGGPSAVRTGARLAVWVLWIAAVSLLGPALKLSAGLRGLIFWVPFVGAVAVGWGWACRVLDQRVEAPTRGGARS